MVLRTADLYPFIIMYQVAPNYSPKRLSYRQPSALLEASLDSPRACPGLELEEELIY